MPKLAEALVERKSLQEKVGRLQVRLTTNAKVQEGDTPDEHPADLVEEVGHALADIKRLTIAINRTNNETRLPRASGDTQTLMEAIAERDRLKAEWQCLAALSNAARIEPSRGYAVTRSEIKWRSTVDVADLQKQIDDLSQRYRLLDTQIQEANWLTDLFQN